MKRLLDIFKKKRTLAEVMIVDDPDDPRDVAIDKAIEILMMTKRDKIKKAELIDAIDSVIDILISATEND